MLQKESPYLRIKKKASTQLNSERRKYNIYAVE